MNEAINQVDGLVKWKRTRWTAAAAAAARTRQWGGHRHAWYFTTTILFPVGLACAMAFRRCIYAVTGPDQQVSAKAWGETCPHFVLFFSSLLAPLVAKASAWQ